MFYCVITLYKIIFSQVKKVSHSVRWEGKGCDHQAQYVCFTMEDQQCSVDISRRCKWETITLSSPRFSSSNEVILMLLAKRKQNVILPPCGFVGRFINDTLLIHFTLKTDSSLSKHFSVLILGFSSFSCYFLPEA